MNMRSFIYLIIGFVSGLFTSGVHRWLVIEYQTSSLLPGYVSYVSLALIAMGIAIAYPVRTHSLSIAVGMGLPVIATIVAFKEMSLDPTSNNLWPIAIVFTFFLATVPALIGSAAGRRMALYLGDRPDFWKRLAPVLIWAAGITASLGLLIAVKINPAYIDARSAYRSVHFGINDADRRLTFAGNFDKLAHEALGYEATEVSQRQAILELKTGRELWTITDPYTKRESTESGVRQFSRPGMNCFGVSAKPTGEIFDRFHMLCIITDDNLIKAQNILHAPYEFSAKKGELYYRIDLSPSALPLFYTLENTWHSDKVSIFVNHRP